MKHHLRSYPEYFEATIHGNKTHELRADTDGGPFAVGDSIVLQEYDPKTSMYTGRECKVSITYMSPMPKPWLKEGYSLLSIHLIKKPWWKVWGEQE